MNGAGLEAIVLAGGRGARLGGDKATVRLGGERLVDRAVTGARAAGAGAVVVVGPPAAVPTGCRAAREDPPFGGPLAALAAGLPLLDAEGSVLLLSCDLEDPAGAAARLAAESLGPDEDAVVLRDPAGRAQWLAGRYGTVALARAVARCGEPAGRPLRAALAALRVRYLDVPAELAADIDTPDDLARARARRSAPTSRGGPVPADRHLPPEALDAWLAAAARELGLDPAAVSVGTVLDVARDVAHGVARPAAPLTTFLLGVAVGRAGEAGASEALRRESARLTELAAEWPGPGE